MMELAMYKGPPPGWAHKVGHWATKTFTASKYSHCEIIINGTAMSSSNRDGGVRFKQLDLTTGRWDVFPLAGDESKVWDWFATHAGEGYDWAGVLRFGLPFLPQRQSQWFCSEACAAALGLDSPHKYSPEGLHQWSISHA